MSTEQIAVVLRLFVFILFAIGVGLLLKLFSRHPTGVLVGMILLVFSLLFLVTNKYPAMTPLVFWGLFGIFVAYGVTEAGRFLWYKYHRK